ncbi:hypothetical protein Taro_042404 [Colocasia esculenta]|uniref:Uncharacterized protein n=1 Tax=Colocasia esculenta TaxID=4460 RepID=A0A843WYG8_COLES|nr:hypothetical protein [Colocasia esculenta]
MPAPQEIPGFYFDEEKNRYFPIKGPIPGRGPKRPPRPSAAASSEASTSSTCSYSSDPSSSSQHIKPRKGHLKSSDFRRKSMRTTGLLQARELHGRLIPFNESRFNFEQEYEKVKVSHPLV